MERKLHIGGKVSSEGWEVMNALPAPYVDHVGNAKDMSRFADCTFSEIYASHVLEHFDYQNELIQTLKEWRRVMKPLGKLYISVPDIDVLARLLLMKDRLSINERFHVMRIIFGGHVDQYDYHVVGLNEDFLKHFLRTAGFGGIRKAETLGIFQDTSSMTFGGELISLNLVCKKVLD